MGRGEVVSAGEAAGTRCAFTPGEARAAAKEGLLAMSVAVGLRVLVAMMEEELTRRVGPKHAKLAEGAHPVMRAPLVRSCSAGRRVKVCRPRARTSEGKELRLETYSAFSDDDQLSEVVMERMLAGLATRRHRVANEPVGKSVDARASAMSRSAVSRRFVARTRRAIFELMARDLSELAVVALMIDGVIFADHCCVAALGICADGTKVPLGLFLGETENKKVVTDLLRDLVRRGLRADSGLLVVIDGAKALDTAVRAVFGSVALIQRCVATSGEISPLTCPKKSRGGWTDGSPRRSITWILQPGSGWQRTSLGDLESRWPDAAASVREGLEDMFTIRRLKVSDRLARSLGCTNAIESMISVARSTTRNVKRWRDAEMVKRWAAAGMMNAERSFRRVQGCNDMARLVAGLARHAASVTPQRDTANVA